MKPVRWAQLRDGMVDVSESGLCQCGCGGRATRRFLRGHNRREGGSAYLARNSRPAASGGCIEWIGQLDSDGYGRWVLRGLKAGAHRRAYELAKGPIPEGLEIDHLCFNRACVNPDHLEPVTRAENNRRKAARITHCLHGHEYTPENTLVSNGRRNCRACRALRNPTARRRLWTLAQYKYGWGVFGHRDWCSFEGLERRGLVERLDDGCRPQERRYALTELGRVECARLFPVSPVVLRTYAHQPTGWTSVEGVAA